MIRQLVQTSGPTRWPGFVSCCGSPRRSIRDHGFVHDITLERVSVRRREPLALDDVSFTAPAGTITVVVGASGSGMTRLLRAVAGL